MNKEQLIKELNSYSKEEIIEVYIKYYDCNYNKRTFEYYEEI